ncbi:Zinc/iron permease [Cryomyces antarcticus]
MWDGLLMLLILSTVMAIASFIAGSLPLAFALSQRQLRLIAAVGTGVLVGTSLIVIIPEGIETLYSASGNGHSHVRRGLLGRGGGVVDNAAQKLDIHWTVQGVDGALKKFHSPRSAADKGFDDSTLHYRPQSEPEGDGKTGKETEHQVVPTDESHNDEHDPLIREPSKRNPHAWVGLSLILGFILMYLIDQIPEHAHNHSSQNHRPLHISLDRLSEGLHRAPSHDSSTDTIEPAYPSPSRSRTSATTVGLVIHAAADGIALGASSTLASSRLGLVIFLAIMVHKAPAAFGLTSVLLKQGLTKKRARAHLVVFSLAAPVGALATWAAVRVLGRGRLGGEEGTRFATGVLLLFSGGTFLYVAMHTMQESAHAPISPSDASQIPNGYADTSLFDSYGAQQAAKGPSKSETAAALAGMLIPLLTQFGHAH